MKQPSIPSPSVATEETTSVARLRGLIDVTRRIRGDDELPDLLEAIGTTIATSLGFGTVAISLYRHAWDDFCITSVHGNDRARAALLGISRSHADFEPLLQDRFLRRGAYFVSHDQLDWQALDPRYTPELAVNDEPDAWHPNDSLVVPMRRPDGQLLGILAVDEPHSGHRPSDDDLDVLVAIGDHAAIAVESAQEAACELRHRLALAQLLAVSSWLAAASEIDMILPAVCHAIRDTLGFLRVTIDLADALTGRLETRATVGSTTESSGLTIATILPLLENRFEIEGCFLLPPEEAVLKPGRGSSRNGRGPWAWHDHWLVVPLYDRSGDLVGLIQVDDPEDRLLPDQERLQALRVFANQTTAAILSAAQFEELRFLADHDPLTRLLNRRAFMRQLEGEVAGAVRYDRTFSLVVCDLDGFKALNDRWGHTVGDDALRAVGSVLYRALRLSDGAFRIGGDEFALILPETREDAAGTVVQRVMELLSELADERLEGLRASFGIASCPLHGVEASSLFRLADEALYRAKRDGGGVHVAI